MYTDRRRMGYAAMVKAVPHVDAATRRTAILAKNIPGIQDVYLVKIANAYAPVDVVCPWTWKFVTRCALPAETKTVMELMSSNAPAHPALEVLSIIAVHPGEYMLSMFDGARLLMSTDWWTLADHELDDQLLTWPSKYPLRLIADQVRRMTAPLAALTKLYVNSANKHEVLRVLAEVVEGGDCA